jgi:hypothetical protein
MDLRSKVKCSTLQCMSVEISTEQMVYFFMHFQSIHHTEDFKAYLIARF